MLRQQCSSNLLKPWRCKTCSSYASWSSLGRLWIVSYLTNPNHMIHSSDWPAGRYNQVKYTEMDSTLSQFMNSATYAANNMRIVLFAGDVDTVVHFLGLQQFMKRFSAYQNISVSYSFYIVCLTLLWCLWKTFSWLIRIIGSSLSPLILNGEVLTVEWSVNINRSSTSWLLRY